MGFSLWDHLRDFPHPCPHQWIIKSFCPIPWLTCITHQKHWDELEMETPFPTFSPPHRAHRAVPEPSHRCSRWNPVCIHGPRVDSLFPWRWSTGIVVVLVPSVAAFPQVSLIHTQNPAAGSPWIMCGDLWRNPWDVSMKNPSGNTSRGGSGLCQHRKEFPNLGGWNSCEEKGKKGIQAVFQCSSCRARMIPLPRTTRELENPEVPCTGSQGGQGGRRLQSWNIIWEGI